MVTTPNAALQTAAVTTLAVASGVTALWLTLGALDRPSAAPAPPSAEVRIEYVDEAGNLLPNSIEEEQVVLVVDQFGQPYTPAAPDSGPAPEVATPIPAEIEPESAYVEHDESEEYEEGEHEEYEEDEDDD